MKTNNESGQKTPDTASAIADNATNLSFSHSTKHIKQVNQVNQGTKASQVNIKRH